MVFNHLSAQKKSDIGIFSGVSYYMGEINYTRHFYSPSFAAGGIFRYNFNPRHSFRFNAIYGSLRGDDADFESGFHQVRGASFETSYVDLTLNFEFNFLPYKPTERKKDKYSPYVTGGLGYSYMVSSTVASTNTIVLSYGAGFKFNVTRRLSSGFEWTFRQTFSDKLDGLENRGEEFRTFYHNKDWYSLVGIFVTYKIFKEKVVCPAYDSAYD